MLKIPKMLKPSAKNKTTNGDYERLARLLANVYEIGHISRGRMYRMSFIRGVMAGFGGVVGATILVALLLWILSLFDALPFVEDIRETIRRGR